MLGILVELAPGTRMVFWSWSFVLSFRSVAPVMTDIVFTPVASPHQGVPSTPSTGPALSPPSVTREEAGDCIRDTGYLGHCLAQLRALADLDDQNVALGREILNAAEEAPVEVTASAMVRSMRHGS